MSKNMVEVDIPDGTKCGPCPFARDESGQCTNPEEIPWKLGDKVTYIGTRRDWCLAKYGGTDATHV